MKRIMVVKNGGEEYVKRWWKRKVLCEGVLKEERMQKDRMDEISKG